MNVDGWWREHVGMVSIRTRDSTSGVLPPVPRQDPAGNTVLHTAVALCNDYLIRLLVRHKADLSIQNAEGATPLLLASSTGQEAAVQLLLHSGAGLHIVDNSNRSALELALQGKHMSCLKMLLEQSCVDVNGITKRGSSLLHLAAEIGDDERVGFLLAMQVCRCRCRCRCRRRRRCRCRCRCRRRCR